MKVLSILILCAASANAGLSWTERSAYVQATIPENSVKVGYDKDSSPIYVGRYDHPTQGWIAAKIVKRNEVFCYYSYDGIEKEANYCDILIGKPYEYDWKSASNGNTPKCVVFTGNTNVRLGIGRGKVDGEWVVGTIQKNEGAMHAPYGRYEHILKTYEALVEKKC